MGSNCKPTKEELKKKLESLDIPNVNMAGLREFIIKKCPFFTNALHTVNIEVIHDLDKLKADAIAYTNGTKISICPPKYALYGAERKEENKSWFPTPEVGFAFIILHELGHIVFDTFGRLKRRMPKLWNIATDYQINQFVVKMMKETNMCSSDAYSKMLDVVMTGFLLDPAKYESMSAEMTYDDLYRISVGKGKGGGNSEGDGMAENGPLAGDMVEDEDDKMTNEERMARDIVKNEMKDYVSKNASKMPGSGTFGREFDFVQEPPRVKARDVLKTIVDRTCSLDDWSFSARPGRTAHLMPPRVRAPDLSPIEPDKIRQICVVIDVSGSVGPEQLNAFLNITKDTFKNTKNPVLVVLHTDQVAWYGMIKDINEVPRNISGGTAFKPVLEFLEDYTKRNSIRLSTCVWLSDYYSEMDPQPSDFRGILRQPGREMKWLLFGNKTAKPSTGTTFYLDDIE